jgi:D-arabinose 1-dehydrogenase-like Zn-dependent alcohol dehydrogenase
MIFNHRARVMAMPVTDLALGLQDRQPPRGSPQPGANEIRVRIVIGMGSFGANLARTLFERGNEVLAIDRDKVMTEAAKNVTANAVMTDAAVKENFQVIVIKDSEILVIIGEEKRLSKLNPL